MLSARTRMPTAAGKDSGAPRSTSTSKPAREPLGSFALLRERERSPVDLSAGQLAARINLISGAAFVELRLKAEGRAPEERRVLAGVWLSAVTGVGTDLVQPRIAGLEADGLCR